MALKFKLFGQEVMIGKRLFGLGADDNYIGFADMTGDPKQFARLKSYEGLVYACINRIAETYASYEPVFERRQGDDWKAIPDHEFKRLLEKPGGQDDKAVPVTLYDILVATASFIELQGDCYWYMGLGQYTGKPREIVVLRADKVGQVIDEETGEITGFFVRTNGGANKIPIEINEMLPFIGFNPEDAYHGKGTVQAGADYIETDRHTTGFTKNFFKNNAGLSGVLTFKGDLTKGAFKKAVRAWRDKYQGVNNAGKVMMIRDSEASFVKVGLGLNELDMSALRKMSREDIGVMFGVPLPLLGLITEGAGLGRANIEVLEYIFAKYTIEPKMKRLDDILQFALERYWGETDIRITHANIIPEDKEYDLNVLDKGVDRWITRNEARAEDGMDAVDGGDDLRASFTTMPISEDFAPVDNSSSSTSNSIKIKIKRKHLSTAKKKDHDQEISSVAKENFRLRLMRNQTIYERRYKSKFLPILKKQRKEALYNLEAHASAWTAKAQLKLFDDAAADNEMLEAIEPVLTGLGEDQGALAMLFAGDEEHEFRLTANYKKYIQRSTLKMAKRFNDETLEKLNDTLSEGIQAGEALDKLRKRVDEVYDGAERYRTLRVARTETLKASNSATTEAYRQTGYVTGKQWYVNPGACPECEEFDGKTIGLDDNFVEQGASYTFTDENGDEQTKTNDYDTIEEPPLHPNCRCTVVPVR